MTTKPFATGRCLCGAVTFTVNAAPLAMGQCHCKDCQQSSGTGHMSLAFFKKADVEVKGALASYGAKADSGNINTRHFCPTCGSRIYGDNSARSHLMGISAGVFDDHSWFTPQRIVYAKDKPAWDMMATDITTFDMMPPPPK